MQAIFVAAAAGDGGGGGVAAAAVVVAVVAAVVVCLAKTRRAPYRLCTDAMAYGQSKAAMR